MTGKEQYTIDVTGTNDHSGMSASTADLYETEANHVVWAMYLRRLYEDSLISNID